MVNGYRLKVMDYQLLSMVAGVTASVVMAVVMWSAARHFGERKWRYVLLLQMLAVTGLIGAVVLFAEIGLRIMGVDTAFMYYFILPVAGLSEIGLVIYAVFYVVQGSVRLLRKLVYLVVAFFTVSVLYPCVYRVYIGEDDAFWDIDTYMSFVDTWQSICLTSVLLVTGVLFLVMATGEVIRGYNRYRDLLDMYLSEDLTGIRQQCLKWLVCCILYSVCTCVNVVSTTAEVYVVSRLGMILFYVAVCVLVLENHETLERVELAFRTIKRKNIVVRTAEGALDEEDTPEVTRIKTLMERWIAREDKPYMRVGITLQNLADDIHIQMPLLVKYGYQIYGTTFREWILSLREGQKLFV